jgi:hypothetical protein
MSLKKKFLREKKHMRKKLKFITSVALLSLSVFGLVMGVYSLVQRQISIGGTVSFSASTVRADYLVERADAYTGAAVPVYTTISSGSFNVDMQDNATAELGNIMLSDNAEKVAYRVTITSTETTRDLIVDHTVPTFTQPWLSAYVNDELEPLTTTHTLTQGQEMVFTFVIVADSATAPETAEDINIGSDFTISLTTEEEEIETIARVQRRLLKEQQSQQNIVNNSAQTIDNTTNQKTNTTNHDVLSNNSNSTNTNVENTTNSANNSATTENMSTPQQRNISRFGRTQQQNQTN